MPFNKQRRFLEQYQLPYTLTSVLVWDKELADYFEAAAGASGRPQAAGNWIVNDLLRELGAAKLGIFESRIKPAQLAELVKLVDAGTILTNAAKEVFIEMFATGDSALAIADRCGLKAAPSDNAELEKWCRDSIAGNAKALAEFKAGKESAINAFKGPVMKAAKGKANPQLVDETLRRLLGTL